MSIQDKIKIFLVDDDTVFLKLLKAEFEHQSDFIIETYVSGELCLQSLSHSPDVIILDYLLDGTDKSAMNGVQTLDKIKAYNPDIPIVMLSSQDKIEVAIICMHHRAFDYVVKSERTFARLKKIITTIFQHQNINKELTWHFDH